MKIKSLSMRLLYASMLLIAVAGVAFNVVAWWLVSSQVTAQAEREASRQASEAIGRLTMIDSLTREQVAVGMRILQREGFSMGQPALHGTATFGGKTVPNLVLGSESQVGAFALVDRVKKTVGGTATLFVWDGASFTRVSTNVMKPDGTRAVGTVLDPNGKAFAALAAGQEFQGVVDILRVPYTTSYVPIRDQNGRMIGAWYTGYRLDSIDSIGESIASATILDHGFLALLKPSGAVMFHGSNIDEKKLAGLLDKSGSWRLHRTTYPAWGYTLVAAYPQSDVRSRQVRTCAMLAAGMLILVAFLVAFQFIFMRRQVILPVTELTGRLENADLNTLLQVERSDEIGALASAFNNFVLRLRETLYQVQGGSGATTSKSGEIRRISNDAVRLMEDQKRSAEAASEAVARLSSGISSSSTLTADASSRTREAAEASRRGGEQVEAAVKMIREVSDDTSQSAASVEQLNERAKQIGTIVQMIDEIASGSNLLALNASIEAARAGEQGRGFAVVAGEVRRLAERTAQATSQVSELVSGIAQETAQAAEGIRSACTRATAGAEEIAGLTSTFERIAALVIEADCRVDQIALSSREESQEAEAVSRAVQSMAESARQSADGAHEVMAAANDLQQTATELEDLVRQFELTAA